MLEWLWLGLTRSDQASAPVQPLAREDTLPLVPQPAVGAEHVTDLAAAHADIAGGHVGVGADVLAQPLHEGVAEFTDLVVALALGVKVGSSLSTAHVHCTGEKKTTGQFFKCFIYVYVMAIRPSMDGSELTSGKSILENLLETEELQDG